VAHAGQVINKAVAAELIFVGTTNFDKALYTEGCDVDHLLEGLGEKGVTKLFHNLSILAWAVVIAKVCQFDKWSCLLKTPNTALISSLIGPCVWKLTAGWRQMPVSAALV
jgi:hypothetical protein